MNNFLNALGVVKQASNVLREEYLSFFATCNLECRVAPSCSKKRKEGSVANEENCSKEAHEKDSECQCSAISFEKSSICVVCGTEFTLSSVGSDKKLAEDACAPCNVTLSLTCFICNYTHLDLKSKVQHAKQWHKHNCFVCQRLFATQEAAESHTLKCIDNAKEPDKSLYAKVLFAVCNKDASLSCEKCSMQVTSFQELSAHMMSKHLYKVCELCSGVVSTSACLRKHFLSQHVLILICLHCDQKFASLESRVKHCEIEHEQVCVFCQKNCSTEITKSDHAPECWKLLPNLLKRHFPQPP